VHHRVLGYGQAGDDTLDLSVNNLSVLSASLGELPGSCDFVGISFAGFFSSTTVVFSGAGGGVFGNFTGCVPPGVVSKAGADPHTCKVAETGSGYVASPSRRFVVDQFGERSGTNGAAIGIEVGQPDRLEAAVDLFDRWAGGNIVLDHVDQMG